jgi:hypothetical protein
MFTKLFKTAAFGVKACCSISRKEYELQEEWEELFNTWMDEHSI